jgi:hypothetical protein
VKILDEIKLMWNIKDIWQSAEKETRMSSATTLWSKFIVIFHTVGPQILNLVLMAKGMLPAQYGVWVSVVLGLGTYVIHVYHDIKTGGLAALESDVSQLSVTTTATSAK